MEDKENLKSMPDILGIPLYESLLLDEYSYEKIIQILTYFDSELNEFSITSLDCFCPKCEKPTTFKSRNSNKEILDLVYSRMKACEEYNRSNSKWTFNYSSFFNILHEIEFFSRSFYCPRNPNDKSHDIIVMFRINENKIIKLGQLPQLADLENSQLNKYKAIEKEIYQELNRAAGLYSHGIGVGSFVYLRRIIEKYIVYPEIEKLVEDENITKEQVLSSDFKGKIALAKQHLPTLLVKNPRIYSILSKGIHSLSEKECLEIFNPLLIAIELILDERLEKIEREKKILKMTEDLNRISK
jgi:hypothetical protein